MAEHLSEDQLSELRGRLSARYDELREEIAAQLRESESGRFQEVAGAVSDPGELSVADLIEDLNLTELDRHTRELQDIEAALQRMDLDTYGICIDCEAAIPYQRLLAYPTARRCAEDQTVVERQEGPLPHPKM